jgi:hypothetical protein
MLMPAVLPVPSAAIPKTLLVIVVRSIMTCAEPLPEGLTTMPPPIVPFPLSEIELFDT